MPETREEIAERLAIRIHDALSSPDPNGEAFDPKIIGMLGAVLYGADDEDVAALRGETSARLDVSEIPDLIATGLRILNDPRINDIQADGGIGYGEVNILGNDGTRFSLHYNDIEEEEPGHLEDETSEDTSVVMDSPEIRAEQQVIDQCLAKIRYEDHHEDDSDYKPGPVS